MTQFACICLFLCGAAFQQAIDGEHILGLPPVLIIIASLLGALGWTATALAQVAA